MLHIVDGYGKIPVDTQRKQKKTMPTPESLALAEGDIMNNYARLINARAHNEGILERTFEQRMNLALEEWSRIKHLGEVGVGGGAS